MRRRDFFKIFATPVVISLLNRCSSKPDLDIEVEIPLRFNNVLEYLTNQQYRNVRLKYYEGNSIKSDKIIIYYNGKKRNVIEDHNKDGIIGNSPLDKYVIYLDDCRKREISQNCIKTEDGDKFYESTFEHKLAIELGRRELEKVTTLYQYLKEQI